MKKSIIIGIAIGVIILAGLAYFLIYPPQNPGTENQQGNPNSIEIKNFAFSPSSITIKAGDEVTWINHDSAPHTITANSGEEPMSETLNNGDSYSHVFNTPGTYDYHCSIHSNMKGEIIVE